MTRKFSSISVESTLASGISSSQTTLTVAAGTGSTLLGGVTLAAGNVDQFTLAIDPDTTNEEIVFATAIASDTFTIVRGRAGSSNISHSGGATVRHVLTSDDLTFFNTGVATADAAIPKSTVTTKGDLIAATASATVNRLAVGSSNQSLLVDSTTSTGIKWGASSTSTLTTTGDLLYASAANTLARRAVGSTGDVLTVTGGLPVWAAPVATPPAGFVAKVATSQNTTSTSYTDLATSGPAVTLTTGTKALVIITCASANTDINRTCLMSYAVSGATTIAASDSIAAINQNSSQTSTMRYSSASVPTLTAGSNTFTAKYAVNAGTGTFSDREIFVINLA